MTHVSRPLIGLLVATVAVFALWIVALKPSASTSGHSGPQGLGQFQSSINAAHGAVATANGSSARHGGVVPSGSGSATAPGNGTGPAKTAAKANGAAPANSSAQTKPANGSSSKVAARKAPASTPADDAATVVAALRAHKAVAILFYNPSAPDDQAVKHELGAVPTHGGRVVKLAVPLGELTSFPAITNQVPIDSTPTLVLINRQQHASTIVGYASGFEITQRITDTLN